MTKCKWVKVCHQKDLVWFPPEASHMVVFPDTRIRTQKNIYCVSRLSSFMMEGREIKEISSMREVLGWRQCFIHHVMFAQVKFTALNVDISNERGMWSTSNWLHISAEICFLRANSVWACSGTLTKTGCFVTASVNANLYSQSWRSGMFPMQVQCLLRVSSVVTAVM